MAAVQPIIAAASLVYGIVQGERGSQAQKKGLRLQGEAQQAAMASAARAEQTAADQWARENRKAPDIGALLTSEQQLAGSGSLLSGAAGVPGGKLKLGRPTLLGG